MKIVILKFKNINYFMYITASFDCKFKGNLKNIENVLQHFGLRKIQPTLYAGVLDNNERKILIENINQLSLK